MHTANTDYTGACGNGPCSIWLDAARTLSEGPAERAPQLERYTQCCGRHTLRRGLETFGQGQLPSTPGEHGQRGEQSTGTGAGPAHARATTHRARAGGGVGIERRAHMGALREPAHPGPDEPGPTPGTRTDPEASALGHHYAGGPRFPPDPGRLRRGGAQCHPPARAGAKEDGPAS